MNELERRLVAAARDPAERPAFSQLLLASDVFVLGTMDQPPVDGVAQAGAMANLLSFTDADGSFTAFFSSEATVELTVAARPGTDPRFLRLPCRALFELTKGARLVLNPDAPYGKVFLPSEVAALGRGAEPGLDRQVLQAERQVLVGVPVHTPPALPEVLARFLVQRPTVEAAHLGWIAHPDGHTGFLMVLLAGDRDAAMAGFGSLQIGELTEGETLDVMVVAPGTRDHLLANIPSFYRLAAQADLPEPPKRRWFRRS
ncbi:enhanced serine sensitivity protein SseB C-terminal domain-containing protein [Aquihabitans sp. G128]|uniref:enhanced serine sensitivity protein SseB C-terminal domain-containing protein n=1 Tax=Aquihabitans sp. G128 TaxID=2849779 RepID=UPI001C23AEB3|nr:enhanced serine sensitivity protein SseB C-terminal domain-containing protein [Aquihabitans sp. G128]QXC59901.1 enhanced serine sensitivity protein SseB C-terminal domain-containing protein [Aquihabitans sp. G128]